MTGTVLCVDDHLQELELRKYLLEQRGYRVLAASDGFAAVELAEKNPLTLAILDYRMDGMDGEAIAKVLKARHPQLPILMLSGFDVPASARQYVDRTLAKGQPVEDLLAAVDEMT